MKVAHFITSLNIGGAEKLLSESIPLYKHFCKNVKVLTLKRTNSVFEKKIETLLGDDILCLNSCSVYDPRNIFYIMKYLKDFDLIHVHLFPMLYWVVIAKFLSRANVKLVYTEHSTSNRRRNNLFFKLCDRWIYSKLDFIGCISQGTYSNLVEHLNYTKKNIRVINNGINLDNFESVHPENNIYFKDSFVLIQVSSFRISKDQKTVIKSLSLLPEDIKLLLVGDGDLRLECEQLVDKLGLNARVKFLGNKSEIISLLSMSDLVIQSSNYEGFGLAAVEGMACGKVVIGSDVDGLKEVIDGYGILFPKGDYSSLSDRIKEIHENKILKHKLEIRCKKRSEDFSLTNMVKSYVDVYQLVLNKYFLNNEKK